MAHVAGLDPVATLARAMVEKFEGKPKGDRLMKALGKALLVTGAAIGSAGATAAAIYSTIPTTHSGLAWILTTVNTICIMSTHVMLKKCAICHAARTYVKK